MDEKIWYQRLLQRWELQIHVNKPLLHIFVIQILRTEFVKN